VSVFKLEAAASHTQRRAVQEGRRAALAPA
jgi:hypothetical protein